VSSKARCEGLRPLFFPGSVVVIGAGGDGLGRLVLDHLIRDGFAGAISVVHPTRREVAGIAAAPSVGEVPSVPDLAVIALPRDLAVEAAIQCTEVGCRAIVMVSAGFAETGDVGISAQRKLVDAVRRTGTRLLGPNCMGLVNTHPGARLNASFGASPIADGSVAVVTQSGSIGDYFIYHCREWGLGVSLLASVGNEADLTLADLIDAASGDDRTRVVASYVEHPAMPVEVLRAVREASASRPVVVLRGGRTRGGAAMSKSNTGHTAPQITEGATDALLRRAGAVLVSSLEELMVGCVALSRHPNGAGRGIAVVTNAGGPAVLAVDAIEACGLETCAPVIDLTASATHEGFSRALAGLPPADSLLCLIMSPDGTDPGPSVETVLRGWSGPLAFCLLARGERVEAARLRLTDAGVPVTREPALAVAALRALADRRSPLPTSGASPKIPPTSGL
jgi:acyl-CoA synthetase (NDP forming)